MRVFGEPGTGTTFARPLVVLVAVGGFVAAAAFAAAEDATFLADEQGTPNVVVPTGSPVACGAPVSSWGSATASDVQVQIEQVSHDVSIAGTPTPAANGRHLIVELSIANLGDADIRIEREDVTVRTCDGDELHPEADAMDAEALLGAFAPGDERAGELAFAVDDGDQGQTFVVGIQEENRTGARIECDLVVVRNNNENVGEIAEGCDAFGGTGRAGADAVGDAATAAADAGD